MWLHIPVETRGQRTDAEAGAMTYDGGLLGQLTEFCERFSIPYLGVNVTELKRHILGEGNAPGSDYVWKMNTLGFSAKFQDEAVALALLKFCFERLLDRQRFSLHS